MTSDISWPSFPPKREAPKRHVERPLVHPFHVGETYANRRGKYEVVQLAPPKATVRYEDGTMMEADIAILARIWENMQSPEEPAKPEPRQRPTRRPAAQPRAPRNVPAVPGTGRR